MKSWWKYVALFLLLPLVLLWASVGRAAGETWAGIYLMAEAPDIGVVPVPSDTPSVSEVPSVPDVPSPIVEPSPLPVPSAPTVSGVPAMPSESVEPSEPSVSSVLPSEQPSTQQPLESMDPALPDQSVTSDEPSESIESSDPGASSVPGGADELGGADASQELDGADESPEPGGADASQKPNGADQPDEEAELPDESDISSQVTEEVQEAVGASGSDSSSSTQSSQAATSSSSKPSQSSRPSSSAGQSSSSSRSEQSVSSSRSDQSSRSSARPSWSTQPDESDLSTFPPDEDLEGESSSDIDALFPNIGLPEDELTEGADASEVAGALEDAENEVAQANRNFPVWVLVIGVVLMVVSAIGFVVLQRSQRQPQKAEEFSESQSPRSVRTSREPNASPPHGRSQQKHHSLRGQENPVPQVVQGGVRAVSQKPVAVVASEGDCVFMRLEVISGTCTTRITAFYLMDELIIGRGSQCDISWQDEAVSPRNSRVYLNDNLVYIEDLRSKYGTTLGGMRLRAPSQLYSGDEIAIGPVRFRLIFQDRLR